MWPLSTCPRSRTVFIIGACSFAVFLILVGVSAKLFLRHLAHAKHVGPLHKFELSVKTDALTEELAIAKAREALKLDGDDTALWQPIRDPQTFLASRGYGIASEFGSTDGFLSREMKRGTNFGIIIFDSDTEAVRFVRVGLYKSTVFCQCSAGR
jgi:hypothetical protein